MSIDIINRWTGAILRSSETAATVAQAVIEAVDNAANLRDANLGGANLRDANLRDANLRDANLGDANLRDADLRGADLRGANLRDANLGGADLRDANLRDADLRDANLRDADLRGANLGGANLGGAKQFIMQIQGSNHQIVAIDDDIQIGCQRYLLSYWLLNFEEIGARNGYDAFQIAEYGDHLQYIQRRLAAWKQIKAEAAQ